MKGARGRLSGTGPPLHSTRVGRQKALVERADVLVALGAGIAERVERAEDSLIGNIAENKTQVASGRPRGQQPLDRGPGVAKRPIGIAPAVADDVVERFIAQMYVDHILPKMLEQLLSRRHVLTPPSRLVLPSAS